MEEAIQFLKESRQLSKTMKRPDLEIVSLQNLIDVLSSVERKQEAMELIQELLQLSSVQKSPEGEIQALQQLATIDMGSSNFSEAEKNLKQTLHLTSKVSTFAISPNSLSYTHWLFSSNLFLNSHTCTKKKKKIAGECAEREGHCPSGRVAYFAG